MAKPVRHLTIRHPDLSEPVTVEIPWDDFPEGGKEELDRLDQNDSGDIVYCAQSSYETSKDSCEISPSNDTSDHFSRLFWAFEGDSPYNDYLKDKKSYPGRRAKAAAVQGEVYSKVVEPLLADPKNEKRWEEVKALLRTMADPDDFLRVVREKGVPESTAEEFLNEAKRLAAETRWGREEFLEAINGYLEPFRALDQKMEEQFRETMKGPSIDLKSGAPAVFAAKDLEQKEEVIFPVTVPKGYTRKRVIENLNRLNPRLRIEGKEYPLRAKKIVPAGSVDDRSMQGIDPTETSLIRKDRIDEVGYGESRDHYFVSFSVAEAEEIFQAPEIYQCDLVTDQQEVRGVDFHNKDGHPITVILTSDAHLEERHFQKKKEMSDSLKAEGKRNQGIIERIERFADRINEKAEAAIEIWNREGVDFVVGAGDFFDYTNIAATSEDQGYRGTNLPLFDRLRSKIKAVTIFTGGNHERRIRPYPESAYEQGFSDDPELYSYNAKHYDAHHFNPPAGFSLWEGLRALATWRFNEQPNDLPQAGERTKTFLGGVLSEVVSGDRYREDDEGLRWYYRMVQDREAGVTYLGNNNFLYTLESHGDDFNQQSWAFEWATEPVGLNLIESKGAYVDDKRPNGKGPRPEAIRHLLQVAEKIQQKEGSLTLVLHHPIFFRGVGPDGFTNSEGTVRGEAGLLLALIAWRLRKKNGEPVIGMVVGGHVHRYGEYALEFVMSEEERKEFEADLDQLLANIRMGEIEGREIFEKVKELRLKYDLDQHLFVDSRLDSKKGFPAEIGQEYNRDSEAFGKKRGPFFLNLPASGPSTADSPSGYVKLTIAPDGKKSYDVQYFYLETDGTVLKGDGKELPQLKEEHRRRIRDWKISHGEKDPRVPQDSDSFTPPPILTRKEQLDLAYAGPPLIDFLPLLCQKQKICLGAGVGMNARPRLGDFRSLYDSLNYEVTPIRVTLPVSRSHHTVFAPLTSPNYLRIGLKYLMSEDRDDWLLDASLGYGLFEPHVFIGLHPEDPDNLFGVGLDFGGASSIVIPAIGVSVLTTSSSDTATLQVEAKWDWDEYSFLRRRHHHDHHSALSLIGGHQQYLRSGVRFGAGIPFSLNDDLPELQFTFSPLQSGWNGRVSSLFNRVSPEVRVGIARDEKNYFFGSRFGLGRSRKEGAAFGIDGRIGITEEFKPLVGVETFFRDPHRDIVPEIFLGLEKGVDRPFAFTMGIGVGIPWPL